METCANPVFSTRGKGDTKERESSRWNRPCTWTAQELVIPREISDVVRPAMLRAWVEAEIERFTPMVAAKPLAGPAAVERFRNMLKVMCFAYALGITRSTEIVQACAREPEFQRVAGNLHPFADELKSFRRRYRAIIEAVLERIFFRAAVWHGEFGPELLPVRLDEQCVNIARGLLNVARHLDSCDDC
jgi:hypothetical protein